MPDDCIFCRIIDGEIPAFRVHEDEETLAFMDINPVHEGHVLVIPKEHAENIFTVSESALAATMRAAQRVARAVNETLHAPGMNLLQCNGKAAAQSVLHFHVHVLPRQTNDGVPLNWELRSGDMEAIGKLAERIRENL